MSDQERFDGMFMNIAQSANGIEPLLDNLFSFLRRKTDFFQGADDTKIKDLVNGCISKQRRIYEEDREKARAKAEREQKKKDAAAAKKKKEEAAANAAKSGEEDVIELGDDGSFDVSASSSNATPPVPPSNNDTSTAKEDSKEEGEGEVEEDTGTGLKPNLGNGYTYEKFSWTQVLSELVVNVKLPPGTKGKMLSVDIQNNSLSVKLKATGEVLYGGKLHKRIVVDDSLWTIEDDEVVMTLTKDNKMEWWKKVLEDEEDINTQKINPENSKLGDLDGETRATVEKMMFDQRQKQMGKPTSDEMQKQEMLNKFMKAHPEMDFSNAKFS